MGNIYKCASYSRLSKEDENRTDESSSISSQKLVISSFAKFNNLEIIEEYQDDGYSGGNFDRPGFKQMIDDIELGKINCIITKDLSRLGREMYKTGSYIEQYFLEKGIRYIAINDSFDSNIGDSMLGLRLGINDLYLRDVSKKVKGSFKVKQEKGDYIGSLACYGYMKDPEDKHHLLPDPIASQYVKIMFDMALEGKGIKAIANKLTEMKIPIPCVYKKESRARDITDNDGNGIWRPATIRNILKSEMYIGNMVQNTYNKISYNSKKVKKVKPKDYIIVEKTHEPLVSKEIFDRVQQGLKNRTKTVNLERKQKKFLFTGLLYCKDCRRTLNIYEKKLKSHNSYYTQCNLYTKKGKYGYCSPHRINYRWLEVDLIEHIRKMGEAFLENYESDNLIDQVNNIMNEDKVGLQEMLDNVIINISKSERMLDNLYYDKIENKIDDGTYQRLSERHIKELDNLKEKKSELTNKMKEIENNALNIDCDKCKRTIEKYIKAENPTHELIYQLIERIEINEEKEIDIYFKFKEEEFMLR